MAEREGFEPPVHLRVLRISSATRSTTLPPLREGFEPMVRRRDSLSPLCRQAPNLGIVSGFWEVGQCEFRDEASPLPNSVTNTLNCGQQISIAKLARRNTVLVGAIQISRSEFNLAVMGKSYPKSGLGRWSKGKTLALPCSTFPRFRGGQ